MEGNSYVLAGGPDGAPTAIYAGLGLAKGTTYLFAEGDAGGTSQSAKMLQEKQAAHTIERQAARERADEQERMRRQEQARGHGHEMSF